MNHEARLPQQYRICGRTVYVFKGRLNGMHATGWCFWLLGRDPVRGFSTRKAAIEQARKSLAPSSPPLLPG
jgi:hypothetical protein